MYSEFFAAHMSIYLIINQLLCYVVATMKYGCSLGIAEASCWSTSMYPLRSLEPGGALTRTRLGFRDRGDMDVSCAGRCRRVFSKRAAALVALITEEKWSLCARGTYPSVFCKSCLIIILRKNKTASWSGHTNLAWHVGHIELR